MKLVLHSTALVVGFTPAQNPADTSAAALHRDIAWRAEHHGRGWRIAAGVIWLVVIVYGLMLATRFVRAIERLADRTPGTAR